MKLKGIALVAVVVVTFTFCWLQSITVCVNSRAVSLGKLSLAEGSRVVNLVVLPERVFQLSLWADILDDDPSAGQLYAAFKELVLTFEFKDVDGDTVFRFDTVQEPLSMVNWHRPYVGVAVHAPHELHTTLEGMGTVELVVHVESMGAMPTGHQCYVMMAWDE